MMSEQAKEPELLMLDNLFHVEYKYDAGKKGSPFYMEMKDNKKIFANKCPSCGRMSVPSRPFCGLCAGVEMTGWVEQGDVGTLEVLTIQYYQFSHPRTGETKAVPWASGQIRLDGGALVRHYLQPADPNSLKEGDRVKAVWRDQRRGHFTDIKYFEKCDPDEARFTPTGAEPMAAEPHCMHSQLKVIYHKTAGSLLSRVLTGLRDKAAILGSKCHQCGKVYAPAVETCEQCCIPLEELVPVSGKGKVSGFTVVRKAEKQHPVSVPYVLATIQLAGADTGITHILGELDAIDQVSIGMEVEPLFKNERAGTILDIKYFRPVSDVNLEKPWTFDN
jgi:uncharacterized OB-fold protein